MSQGDTPFHNRCTIHSLLSYRILDYLHNCDIPCFFLQKMLVISDYFVSLRHHLRYTLQFYMRYGSTRFYE